MGIIEDLDGVQKNIDVMKDIIKTSVINDIEENKWLKVRPGVVLTESTKSVIISLEKYFEAAHVVAWVTSGLRGPEDQLRIIRNALTSRNLDTKYPDVFKKDVSDKIEVNGKLIYAWQMGWSALLNIGFIVNPPFAAEVLMDYYRPGSTANKKGKVIGQTPHATGRAFDIGGGEGGISKELKVVETAIKNKVKGLKGFLAEHGNNCVHVDCY